jgi:signal transduction histidine kinase
MRVLADRRLMKVALDALLDNAWKFAASSGAAQVWVEGAPAEGAWHLRVSDDGPGFRSSEPGLGLAIADAVARRHGGAAHAATEEVGGARVVLSIAMR